MFRKKFSSKLNELDTLYRRTVSQLAIYVQVAYCESLIKRCEEDLRHNIYEVSKEHTEAVKLAAEKELQMLRHPA